MSALSKLRGFFDRHRNKLIVSGAIVTSSIILFKYAQRRLNEWQERETRDFLERTRKQQHFETTERTCNQTILSLVSTLNDALARAINTDTIVSQLRDNPPNKVQLWEELKLLVFMKASCLINLSVMLVIILRIQLNIIGGNLFKDPNSISSDIQQQYLLLCNNLFDNGLDILTKLVRTEYGKILEDFKLSTPLKLRDFDNIFWSIQSALGAKGENNPINNFKSYLIKNIPMDQTSTNNIYENLIVDTVDLLESEEIKNLMTHCISRGYVLFSDQMAEYYMNNGVNENVKIQEINTNDVNGFLHPSDVEIPVAKVIPIINGLAGGLKGAFYEKLISQLIVNDRLKTLGANIYECFSHS